MLEAAGRVDAPAFEQVVGGLVEWMGNELLEGWLHLPIPVFEAVSGLAEELFRAAQGYHAAMRAAGAPLPAAERVGHEQALRDVLTRLQALEKQGSGAGGRGWGQAHERDQGLGTGDGNASVHPPRTSNLEPGAS
jgi:hypothetical protein